MGDGGAHQKKPVASPNSVNWYWFFGMRNEDVTEEKTKRKIGRR